MKRSKRFNNILDDCLERVLFGEESVEQCLQSYPALAAELEPLLRMAAATKEVSNIKPSTEFRERARYQFRSALQEVPLKKGFRLFAWQSRWATVATAFVILILLSGSTALASSNSMPGEALYPVKLATEQVRLTLTPSALGKAKLYANLADERVSEIIYAANKGESNQVELVTQRLSTHLEQIASLAGVQLEQDSKALLAPVPAPAPALAPTPEPTPAPEEAGENATVPAAPGPQRASKNAKDALQANKQTELSAMVQSRAMKNNARLRAALATAPEPVKATLEQSINVSEKGYERVLKVIEKNEE